MAQSSFEIQIGTDSVTVIRKSAAQRKSEIFMGCITGLFGLGIIQSGLFRHDQLKSLIHSFQNNSDFTHLDPAILFQAVGVLLAIALSGILLLFALHWFLSIGEKLYCDPSQFIIAKTPFLNFGNRWKQLSTPPSQVFGLRHEVVQSTRFGDAYGIRMEIKGETWKLFTGISSSEADSIFQALSRLGVPVREDALSRD